jgi:hypothetical protein
VNASQFDSVTRLFAARRTSRRAALAAGASVLAAGLTSAAAQDATPLPSSSGTPAAADGTGDDVHFLFVQTFGAGSLSPKENEESVMTLVADHLPGETLYFSDRPERIVGMVSTARFIGEGKTDEGLGFTPANPPNAALVFGGSDGQPGDIAVVELIDPRYDPSSGRVTYDLRVLADVEAIDLHLEEAPLTAETAARDFASASLFIDDCGAGQILCANPQSGGVYLPGATFAYCFSTSQGCCAPCAGVSIPDDMDPYTQQCNEEDPDTQCDDGCTAQYQPPPNAC